MLIFIKTNVKTNIIKGTIMTSPEAPAPIRPWQDVEADINAGQALQDEVKTSEEGRYILNELTNLYNESSAAFNQQTETLRTGPIPAENIGTRSLASVQRAKRLSIEEAQKAREEYNVRMGNLDENGFHVTR